MRNKKTALTSLLERREREHEYYLQQAVGTDEYAKSLARLNELDEAIAELEKQLSDRKIDISKFVVGTGVSIGTALVVLKFEETNSLCSALKNVVLGLVNPRKML